MYLIFNNNYFTLNNRRNDAPMTLEELFLLPSTIQFFKNELKFLTNLENNVLIKKAIKIFSGSILKRCYGNFNFIFIARVKQVYTINS